MRLLHALVLIPLFGGPVLAQTATPATAEHHGRRSAQEHFADANTTHDGRLTLDQATAGYKSVSAIAAHLHDCLEQYGLDNAESPKLVALHLDAMRERQNGGLPTGPRSWKSFARRRSRWATD